MFSQQIIQVTLMDAPSEEEDPLVIETESSDGPGYLNPYLFLRGNKKNIFLQTSPISTSQNKIKIIISDPLLRDRPLSAIELSYFASLIQYHEVYLWFGPDVPLMGSRCPMLHSLDHLRENIYPATAAAVIAALGNQGLAIDNTVILDHAATSTAMNRLKKQIEKNSSEDYKLCPAENIFLEDHAPTQLYLEWYSDIERLSEIGSGIDCNRIKSITVQTIRRCDAEKLITFFPTSKQ